MKVYLASRYSRREEMLGAANDLAILGHRVTSRWLNGSHQLPDHAREEYDVHRLAAIRFATEDLLDIDMADTVICFPDEPRIPSTARGGMHVEFGYAIARSKRIIVVGWLQNVFHRLPVVEHYGNWTHCLAALTQGDPAGRERLGLEVHP